MTTARFPPAWVEAFGVSIRCSSMSHCLLEVLTLPPSHAPLSKEPLLSQWPRRGCGWVGENVGETLVS